MNKPLSSPRGEAVSGVEALLASLPAAEDREAWEHMLPAQCYTDPAFFEFERREVLARSWLCVGRVEQLAVPGDHITAAPAGEQVIVVRREDGSIGAMSAVCQHRGHAVTCSGTRIRCPLHSWTYDLDGRLIGAPHMGDAAAIRALRAQTRLPPVRTEIWHGFVFVNLDDDADPLGPSLAKLEPFWAGYEEADLGCLPPRMAETPVPWNWKVQVENFTDAYHTEFVHGGTHDYAPSILGDAGVTYEPMQIGHNAIVRSVPLIAPDGGLMEEGWGEDAAFPPIPTLSAAQRGRLTFAMLPPNMTLMFTPNNIAYTILQPVGAAATLASSDRVTAGGWLLPKSTLALPDFAERAKRAQTGASKIWAQDVPVNLSMQRGKQSRYLPAGRYSPLETTLSQFNGWLLAAYRRGAAR